MKQRVSRFVSKLTIFSTIWALAFAGFVPVTNATNDLLTVSDTMSRQKTSTGAEHIIQFDLPGGVTWNALEDIVIDFPAAFTVSATSGGTWVDADIKVEHEVSTAMVELSTADADINTTAAGTLTFSSTCANTAGYKAAVTTAADGSDPSFSIRKCSTAAAGDAGGTIRITLNDAATATTKLLNPSSANTYQVSIRHYVSEVGGDAITTAASADNTNDNVKTVTVPVVSDDQVSVTASIDPTLSFAIDDTALALGQLSTSQFSTDSLTLTLGTNADQGAVISVIGTNGNLLSSSTGGTVATVTNEEEITYSSTTSAAVGLCVADGTSLTRGTHYDASLGSATCSSTTTENQSIGQIFTSHSSNSQIVTTGGAALASTTATVRIFAKASTTTAAAADYAETLTFIATATY